jgi:hypothetical protein
MTRGDEHDENRRETGQEPGRQGPRGSHVVCSLQASDSIAPIAMPQRMAHDTVAQRLEKAR